MNLCVSFTFWQAMDGVRRSQSSTVLSEAEEVTAFLLELAHFSKQWRFSLPDVLGLLQVKSVSECNEHLKCTAQFCSRSSLGAVITCIRAVTIKNYGLLWIYKIGAIDLIYIWRLGDAWLPYICLLFSGFSNVCHSTCGSETWLYY